MEDLKIKIAMLWLFYTVAFSFNLTLIVYQPGNIEQINMGEIYGMQFTPEALLVTAIELLVPLVMAFLTLTLKDSINRWANIILGIVYTVLVLLSFGGELTLPNPPAYSILMDISMVVATALIVWYAWKWKV